MRVLIDDATHGVRIVAGEHAVHHHLRDRDLAAHRLAARFEIYRFGETFFGLGAAAGIELEPVGRRHRPLVLTRDLTFGRHRLTAFAGLILGDRI